MKKLSPSPSVTALLAYICLFAFISPAVRAEDPYLFFTWKVTYGTLSPLDVPQHVILINDQSPGPNINSTTNNNVVINIFNNIGEPILETWNGIQQRKNSWQDGLLGTNCPIPPGKNFTYHFQVNDQIGSYFYFPSTGMHKTVSGSSCNVGLKLALNFRIQNHAMKLARLPPFHLAAAMRTKTPRELACAKGFAHLHSASCRSSPAPPFAIFSLSLFLPQAFCTDVFLSSSFSFFFFSLPSFKRFFSLGFLSLLDSRFKENRALNPTVTTTGLLQLTQLTSSFPLRAPTHPLYPSIEGRPMATTLAAITIPFSFYVSRKKRTD